MRTTTVPNRKPDFVMTLENAANNDSVLGGCDYRIPADKKGRVWTACYWERHNYNNGLITLDDLEEIPNYKPDPNKLGDGLRQVYTNVHKDQMVEIWLDDPKRKDDVIYDLRLYDHKDFLHKRVDFVQYKANFSYNL